MAKAKTWEVRMIPKDGDTTFTDGDTEREYARTIVLQAQDKDEARQAAERQAHDIALQYEEGIYKVDRVKEVE